jgi:hypothetical protein
MSISQAQDSKLLRNSPQSQTTRHPCHCSQFRASNYHYTLEGEGTMISTKAEKDSEQARERSGPRDYDLGTEHYR